MSDGFLEASHSFAAFLGDSVASVPREKEFSVQVESGSRPVSPLYAAASFVRRGKNEDEALVIALQVARRDRRLVGVADISAGDGEVFAEAVVLDAEDPTSTDALQEILESAVTAAERFVEAKLPIVNRELERALVEGVRDRPANNRHSR